LFFNSILNLFFYFVVMDAGYRLLIPCYGSPPAQDTSHEEIFVRA